MSGKQIAAATAASQGRRSFTAAARGQKQLHGSMYTRTVPSAAAASPFVLFFEASCFFVLCFSLKRVQGHSQGSLSASSVRRVYINKLLPSL